MIRIVVGVSLLMVVGAGAVIARQDPAFDVASIKPSSPDHVGAQIFWPTPGRLSTLTTTVKELIAAAYGVRDFQILGGPGWCDSERFDISAKSELIPSNDQRRLMLRGLLADRFQLTVHRETKELGIYSLVVAKSGPNLKKVAAAGLGIGLGKTQLTGKGTDMRTLANVLSNRLDHTVQDHTGLDGFYDFLLTWTPDDATADGPAVSLFTALQEQLGLKLETSKGPVEMLVIDRVQRPSEN